MSKSYELHKAITQTRTSITTSTANCKQFAIKYNNFKTRFTCMFVYIQNFCTSGFVFTFQCEYNNIGSRQGQGFSTTIGIRARNFGSQNHVGTFLPSIVLALSNCSLMCNL